MSRSILFLSILIILCLASCGYDPGAYQLHKNVTTRDTFIDRFSAYFREQMDICHCPGAAVAIVQDTTIRMLKGFGEQSTITHVPIDVHTLFRLASVSKSFASVITQIEVNNHRLKWEDKVTDYLPDFELTPKENTTLVSIGHILSHSSGLPYHSFTNLVESGASIASIIPLFKNIHCKVLPGEEYAYQNASYAMIELILEKAVNKSYPQLLDEIMIDSLHMPDLCYTYASIHDGKDIALPHRPDTSGTYFQPTEISDKYYNTISAGGINASISDMSIWLKVLLGSYPHVISKTSLDTFFKPVIRTTTDRRYYNYWPGVKDSYYAKGMRILDYGDHHKFYHAGYANEYRAEIAIDPRYHLGICVLFNSTCNWSGYVIPDFFMMYDEWMAGCR